MIYSSSYFHAPFFTPTYRRYPPRYAFPQEKKKINKTPISTPQEKNASTAHPLEKETTPQENRTCDDKAVFEIFGIKLFFDDLLLIGLLFFLYSEGVQDQELFFALILLLFS